MPNKNKKGFVPEDEEFYQNKEEKVPAVTPPATMPQGAVQMSSAGIATAAQPQQPELNDEQKLAQVNARLLDETSAAHEAGIQSVADFVGALEKEKQARIQEDENYRKRENAFRYIAGLGDTFSGIANLIGTAHGAANQQQTYSATPIAQKAEAARQKRKAGIDNINERIREQKKNLGDLKAAKSLAEAQARMKAEKEMLELRARNEAEARKQENWAKELEFKQGEADRDYELAQKKLAQSEADTRATIAARIAMNDADNRSREAIEQKKIEAKRAQDPKYKAMVLRQNITGIRDELARKMDYADYNEYLRYQNVEGIGKDIDNQRNRVSRKVRDERAAKHPELVELLGALSNPESLSEENIDMYIGASKVFSDAVKASTGEEYENNTPIVGSSVFDEFN